MELIEELENYSGDVAQRVMSGALAGSYSDSGSSAGDSPRMRPSASAAAMQARGGAPGRSNRAAAPPSEDDSGTIDSAQIRRTPVLGQDAPPSLPPSYSTGAALPSMRPMSGSARQGYAPSRGYPQPPSSVENASAAATGRESEAQSEDENYLANLPGPSGRTPRGGAGRMGPPPARYSQQQQAPPSSRSQQFSQRGPPSLQGDSSRLYAPPPGARGYPPPPPSESAAGAAAGGFGGSSAGQQFYSTSASPAPGSQAGGVHHYYHPRPSESGLASRAPYAASSVGGRSGGEVARPQPARAGSIAGAASQAGGAGAPTRNQQVDQALQSIQASLAALHERLNRVETSRTGWSGIFGAPSGPVGAGGQPGAGRYGALQSAYRAVSNAVHDIAVLLGIRDPTTAAGAALAPSYLASAGGPAEARQRARRDLFAAPLRLAVALLNLFVRLALDAVSLALLTSVFLLLVRRVTGRGDPLLLLRLVRRWTGIQPSVLIGGVAAAATARVNGHTAGAGAAPRRQIGN